jgi:hypothetical protein
MGKTPKCGVRFSEEERRSLDAILGLSEEERRSLDEPGGQARLRANLIRAGSLDELRGKGIPRASLIRAAVRALIDGEIAVAVILGHLREIKRTKRAACKRPAAPLGTPSVRRRVHEVLDAHPGEVLTTARIASLVGGSRDTVRNALLALSGQGRVEKIGAGQYRAQARAQVDEQADAPPAAGAAEAA